MQQLNTLSQVKAFHELFDHPVLDTPTIPDKDRCDLRVGLIQEELNELKEAIESKDIVAVADALTDLQYVLSGTYLEFGLATRAWSLNAEVHRSNMSKACKTLEEASQTIAHHETGKEEDECSFTEKNGLYLVYRNRDKKTMKSINYSPASLKEIVISPDTAYLAK